VDFGPRGGLLVSGGFDATVRLWDTAHWTPKAVPAGHTAAVHGISFSPDGHQLASGSADKTVRLWNVRSGDTQKLLSAHDAGIRDVAYDGSGKRLASSSYDRTIRLWDPTSGAVKRVLIGHTAGPQALSFSPDDRLLASGSTDKTVRLWDVVAGGKSRVLQGHTAGVYGVSFSPDGRTLASGSWDKTARLWNVATGRQNRVLEGHTAGVYGVSFNPDGRQLGTGSLDHSVRLWELSTGKSKVLAKLAGRIYGVAFHPDGKRLGAPCADGTAHLWDTGNGEHQVLRGHRSEVNALGFSADGQLAATCSDDQTVRLWQLPAGKPYWHAPALLGDPPWLFSHRGWQALDDTAKNKPELGAKLSQVIQRQARYVQRAGPGTPVCVYTFDNVLELWDLAADRSYGQHRLSSSGQLVATADGCVVSTEQNVRRYTTAATEPQLLRPTKATGLGWSGQRILVGSTEQVTVFDSGGAKLAQYPIGGATALTRLETDKPADGGWLIAGFADGNLELFPTTRGQSKPSFSFERVPASAPVRMIVGPKNTVIVGYANGLIGIWSLDDGSRLGPGRLHGPVVHLVLAGHKLYAASELGGHLGWDLSAFYVKRCALLRQIWQRVATVWQDGQLVVAPAPAGHGCLD